MRKSLILLSSILAFSFSNLALADTKTDDSTNTYTPSDQLNEKLHQKPVAEDANSGSDMSTTKDEASTLKKDSTKKKHVKKGEDAKSAN